MRSLHGSPSWRLITIHNTIHKTIQHADDDAGLLLHASICLRTAMALVSSVELHGNITRSRAINISALSVHSVCSDRPSSSSTSSSMHSYQCNVPSACQL